jgi:hypothetical protein
LGGALTQGEGASPGLDTGHAAYTRQGLLLRLALWGVWQQAQERADLCHPQGLDFRTSESGYWDDGGMDTGEQGPFSLLHGE